MSLTTQFEIIRLKAKAARLYVNISRRSDLSCGSHLTDFIRPDVPKMVDEFNATMAELAKLDPAAKSIIEKEGPLS